MKKSQFASFALALLMLFGTCFTACSGVQTETTDVQTDSALNAEDGFSIKALPLSSPAGIKFESFTSDEEMLGKLNGKKADFGTLVIPTSQLKGDLSLSTEGALDLKASTLLSNSGEASYSVSIADIGKDRQAYTSLYTAVSYVTYSENGQTVTDYSPQVNVSYYSACKAAQTDDTAEYTQEMADAVKVAEATKINSSSGTLQATVSGFDGAVAGYQNSYIVTAETVLAVEANKENFNRYVLVYSASNPMQAFITYKIGNESITEEFYLQAGSNMEFSSFIDGALDGSFATELVEYKFVNLNSMSSEITLTSISLRNSVVSDTLYLENDNIKFGVSISDGGVINYLEDISSSSGNLIDSIGSTFIGTDDYPHNGEYVANQLNCGKVVYFIRTATQIYVKTRPYDDAQGDFSDCYIEVLYTLNSDSVTVDTTVFDFYEFGHESEKQHLVPRVDPKSALNTFYAYTGTSPWTNASYAKITKSVEFASSNTETWLICGNSSATSAVGVYSPKSHGISVESGAASLYKTDYMPTFSTYDTSYLLAVGSVAEIRTVFNDNKDFSNGSNGVREPAGEFDSYTVNGNYIVTNEGLTAPNNNNNKFGPLVGVSDTGLVLQTTDDDGISVVQQDKYVGLFYFLWLGEHGDSGIYDNTKILATYSDAATNTGRWGSVGAMHFYSEPLYGYYKSNDTWVIRKHVEQLTNAGVDFLYIDCTNGYPYTSNSMALMKVLHEYNEQGWDAPKVVFYTNTNAVSTVQTIYDTIYSTNYYPDTWFYLEGRPVIVAPEASLSTELRNFFTVRENQWPNDGNKKVNGWPWISFFWWNDEVFYNDSGEREAISVSVAQHCSTITFSAASLYGPTRDHGRSYHNGSTSDSYDGDDSYLYGYNFQERWDAAISADVPIVLVTGWNEWVAQRQSPSGSYIINFIDCFDIEFSRDCEMVKGYYFDNYYIQLMYNINKYKGTAPAIIQKQRPDNYINTMTDWADVQVEYLDASGDTVDRSGGGFGGSVYIDTSGRNDIVSSKVCYDSNNVYFYVKCAKDIVSDNSGTRLQLYLNTDYNTTGWYGYDYTISSIIDTSGKVSVNKHNGASSKVCTFAETATADCVISGSEMMITVARSALGLTAEQIKFSFKWVDSETNITTMEQMYTQGDTAPHGRLNYLFQNY